MTVTLKQLALAWRKAKVDLYYSTNPPLFEIVDYEKNLLDNLEQLRQRINGRVHWKSSRPHAQLVSEGDNQMTQPLASLALYYERCAQMFERETHTQRGGGFIEAFSKSLRLAFPDAAGFSGQWGNK